MEAVLLGSKRMELGSQGKGRHTKEKLQRPNWQQVHWNLFMVDVRASRGSAWIPRVLALRLVLDRPPQSRVDVQSSRPQTVVSEE
jgi:hypothetical protein